MESLLGLIIAVVGWALAVYTLTYVLSDPNRFEEHPASVRKFLVSSIVTMSFVVLILTSLLILEFFGAVNYNHVTSIKYIAVYLAVLISGLQLAIMLSGGVIK